MSYLDKFLLNLSKERNSFKQECLGWDSSRIYDNWYKIGFFEAYYELFLSEYAEYDDYREVYQWLSNLPCPLQFLYSEWLKAGEAMSFNWDNMWDFIEEVKKSESE